MSIEQTEQNEEKDQIGTEAAHVHDEACEGHHESAPETEATKNAPVIAKPASKAKMFLLGVGSTIVIVAIVGMFGVVQSVKNGTDQPTLLKIAGILNLSAATINGREIPYVEYKSQMDTLRKFYKTNPQFAAQTGTDVTDQQISDQVLARLVVNELLQQEADKYHISVSATELADARKKLISDFPSEAEAEKSLQSAYGWSLDTYVNKVAKSALLEQKVRTFVTTSTDETFAQYKVEEVDASHMLFLTQNGDSDGKIKARAESTLKQIQKGADFTAAGSALVTKESSLDASKRTVIMEDLGWFSKGKTVPEFEAVAFSLAPGQISNNVVTTTYGYHIIKINGKRMAPSYDKFMETELRKAVIKLQINVHNPFEKLLQNTATANQENTDSSTNQ